MLKRFIVLICLLASTGCTAPPPPEVEVFVPPVFSARPDLIIIDSAPDVYYVRGYANIFFYSGSWYYFYNNVWHISQSYNGPWGIIETHRLPVRFGQIPPGHLRMPPSQAKPKPDRDRNPPQRLRDDDNDGPPGHRRKGK
ncbi:MAG: hypothetical protein AB1599_06560 [Planctomycetota bacterium]